uniref:NADH-ubiquinone oxidoreductase chain 6 n=1 Tax=Leiopelma hochstetteri TaxID=51644 RepID=A0A0F6NCE4_LEIHO|nr:NADH dehydrogenase subunit 6 [Leiopelma hochstetteri]AII41081.1 NADH dehydrogenase subunit 6 [Leiopelma hochstetteri]
MIYLVLLIMVLVGGLIAVASNPSPYYAAFGLVVAAGAGCWVIVVFGGSFLSLVLFLVYLGGMLVVFVYAAALAAEPHPEAWGNWSVLAWILGYTIAVASGYIIWEVEVDFNLLLEGGFSSVRADWGGVAWMYSGGGWMVFIVGWALLLTLFVVLELTRGFSRGGLRAL